VVTLGWTPAATGGVAQSFKLEAALTPGGANLLNPPVTTTARSLVVQGVPENTYFVRVRASNPWGDSGLSPETRVVVGPCQVPSVPVGFTATVDGLNVGFTWSAPASGLVQSYRLTAGFASGQSDAAILDGLTATSFSTGAPAGTYYVRLAAVNVCGAGPATPETMVQLRSCTAAPNAPTNVRATAVGNVVTLGWDAPATGDRPSRYRIRAGLSAGDLSLLGYGVLTSDSRPGLTTTAGPATYYVQVISTNACGDSAPSPTTTVTVRP
jgi:predicted phage tail protein